MVRAVEFLSSPHAIAVVIGLDAHIPASLNRPMAYSANDSRRSRRPRAAPTLSK